MTILDQLAEYAKERVAKDQEKISLEEMKSRAFALEKGDFSFEKALKREKPALICEVKKASPSKGIISHDFPYLEIAKSYERAGATCLSVLTEPKWFMGSDEIFSEIRSATDLPMLRKDFTVDAYQIYQSKVMGADCILLICAILDTETIKNYKNICDSLGLSVLVETHDETEIASALSAGASILGVNNRNLKDFSVNLNHASELKKCVPEGITFVAESGISSSEDGIKLVKEGADALLIGEALMRSEDKSGFVNRVKTGCKS